MLVAGPRLLVTVRLRQRTGRPISRFLADGATELANGPTESAAQLGHSARAEQEDKYSHNDEQFGQTDVRHPITPFVGPPAGRHRLAPPRTPNNAGVEPVLLSAYLPYVPATLALPSG